MNDFDLSNYISRERLKNFSSTTEYIEDITYASKFYKPLAILEIVIRNKIDRRLLHLARGEWLYKEIIYNKKKEIPFGEINKRVIRCENFLKRKMSKKTNIDIEEVIIDRNQLIANLPFSLWLEIIKIDDISISYILNMKLIGNKEYKGKLGNIVSFRNRIYHYEKVLNHKKYQRITEEIKEILTALGDNEKDGEELVKLAFK